MKWNRIPWNAKYCFWAWILRESEFTGPSVKGGFQSLFMCDFPIVRKQCEPLFFMWRLWRHSSPSKHQHHHLRSVVTAVSRKRGLRLSVLFRTMNVGCRSIPPFNRAWMSSISDNTGDLLSLWSHSVLISLSLKIERRHTYNLLKSEKLRKTLRRSWKWTTIEKTWSW